MPELFGILRVLVDRIENKIKFLILGSASPHIIKDVSETLAGRAEFIELAGFNYIETGGDRNHITSLWLRGSFPRFYLSDSLEDSLPWHKNIGKRQVKAPKIYFRDVGILHSLLAITDMNSLMVNPRLGASWEGFALEQALQILQPADVYFWAT